ncbi:MAG: diaminopimelate epimerase [Acidobacteriota bacterium]
MDFLKASGAGNDFVVLPEPLAAPSLEQIRAWCRRGLSLGADGLCVLRRDGDEVAMSYFNADGSEAELCLNGSRCAVRCALELGWGKGEIALRTAAGVLRGRDAGDGRIRLSAPLPEALPRPVEQSIEGTNYRGWFVTVGVPHLVLFQDRPLSDAPVAAAGPALRASPAAGPIGANIHFVRLIGEDRFEIRSYERGVEAETLACGTGVLATAAATHAAGRGGPPWEALTAGGFILGVEGEVSGARIAQWTLTGDARIVARGTLSPGAECLPEPPHWSD